MIERDADRLRITAPMVMDKARALAEAGCAACADGVCIVDMGAVPAADSSALAVMLAWLREAERRGVQLVFANLPDGVRSLAELYGVAELLPLESAPSASS